MSDAEPRRADPPSEKPSDDLRGRPVPLRIDGIIAVWLGGALLTGTAYLYGGWLPRHERYLAPIAVLLPLVAMVQGVRSSRSVRPLARLGTGGLWAAATVALLLLPPVAQRERLRREAAAFPLPPGSYGADSGRWKIDPVRFDGRPDLAVKFVSDVPADEAVALILGRLPDLGWSPTGAERVDWRPDAYYRSQQTLSFVRGGRSLTVRITEAKHQIVIDVELDDPKPRREASDPTKPTNLLGDLAPADRLPGDVDCRPGPNERFAVHRWTG